jgi:hypothetical protein
MDSIAYHVTTLSKTKVIHLPILVAENIQDSKYVLWVLRSNVVPDLPQLQIHVEGHRIMVGRPRMDAGIQQRAGIHPVI